MSRDNSVATLGTATKTEASDSVNKPSNQRQGSSRRKRRIPGRAIVVPELKSDSDEESMDEWADSDSLKRTAIESNDSKNQPLVVALFPSAKKFKTGYKKNNDHDKAAETFSSNNTWQSIESNGEEDEDSVSEHNGSSKSHEPKQMCLYQNERVFSISNHVLAQDHESKLPGYVCHVCEQTFIGAHILEEHLKIHGIRPANIYPCHVCGKILKCQKYLEKHLKIHAEALRRPFDCPVCGANFGTRKGLRQHKLLHKKNKPHKCPHCPKRFDYQGGLRTHMAKHEEYRPYVCPECPQAFKTKETLTRHVRRGKHLVEEEPDVEDQGSAQLSSTSFAKYPAENVLQTGKPDSENTMLSKDASLESQPGDGKAATDDPETSAMVRDEEENSLGAEAESVIPESAYDGSTDSRDGSVSGAQQNEMNSEESTQGNSKMGPETNEEEQSSMKTPERKKKPFPSGKDFGASARRERAIAARVELETHDVFQCFTCRKKYYSKEEFQNHLKEHVLNKPFICTLCGRGLNTQTSLTRHMITHSSEKPLSCDVCGKGFIYNCDLQDHIRSHTGERPFVCTICGKSFATKSIFSGHKKLHSEEKNHICPICSKGFVCKRALKRHMYSHTDVRPYQCDKCPHTFKCPGALKRHMRRHEGIVSYTCEFCSRGFGHLTDYRRHVRIHTGERPFKCEECGKGFKQNHHLLEHERTHKGGKAHECKFCPHKCATRSGLQKHRLRHAPGGDLPLNKGTGSCFPEMAEELSNDA